MTSRPAAPETPEAVHAQLTRKGPNFRGRIRDVIKALRGENEKTVDRAVGHLIGCCKGEMIFRRVALKEIERLERRLTDAEKLEFYWLNQAKVNGEAYEKAATALSLAQTEIKGHMRVQDDLKARIAELEKDAARYRWLREPHLPPINVLTVTTSKGYGLWAKALDAAIDAALKSRA